MHARQQEAYQNTVVNNFDLWRLRLEPLILIGSAVFGATFNLFTRVAIPKFLEQWKMEVWKSIV